MNAFDWKGTARRASVLLAVLVFAGCATKRDIRDINEQISQLAAQQASLMVELQQMGMATQDTLRSTTQELFDIRGDVVRQLNTMSGQLDRIAEMVGQNSLAIQSMRDAMDQLRRSAGRVPTGGALSAPGGNPGGSTARTNGGEQADAAYNTAVGLFNRGSNTAARAAFESFLQDFPRDELAPMAYFYLGDLLYQNDDVDGALAQWARVGEEFPADPANPRVMFRMARVLIEEGDEEEARAVLTRLVNTWGDTVYAEDARDLLDQIGGLAL